MNYTWRENLEVEREVLDKGYRENKSKHFVFNNFFPKNFAVDNVEKIWKSHRGYMTIRFACHVIQTHTQNVWYLLLFHDSNGYAKVPHNTLNVHCLSCHLV